MAHCLKAWVQIWIPELWRERSSSVQYSRFWFVTVSNFTLWCTWFPPECGTSMLPNLSLKAVLSTTFLDFRECESDLKMAAACFHALQYYSLSCKCCSGYHWSLAILQRIFFFLQNFFCIKIAFQKSHLNKISQNSFMLLCLVKRICPRNIFGFHLDFHLFLLIARRFLSVKSHQPDSTSQF